MRRYPVKENHTGSEVCRSFGIDKQTSCYFIIRINVFFPPVCMPRSKARSLKFLWRSQGSKSLYNFAFYVYRLAKEDSSFLAAYEDSGLKFIRKIRRNLFRPLISKFLILLYLFNVCVSSFFFFLTLTWNNHLLHDLCLNVISLSIFVCSVYDFLF